MSAPRLSKAGQVTAAGVGAGVLVLAAGWFLLVSPQHSKATSLDTQTVAAAAQNSALQMQLTQLRAERADLPAEQAALAKVEREIPAAADLPTLIRQLSATASSAGVTVSSLTPGTPTQLTANSTSSAGSTPKAGSTSKAGSPSTQLASGLVVGAIPVTLDVDGGYFEVEQFVSDLENLPRAFLVTGLTLGPYSGSSGSAATGPGAVTASITATIFEAPSLAGPAGAAASAG